MFVLSEYVLRFTCFTLFLLFLLNINSYSIAFAQEKSNPPRYEIPYAESGPTIDGKISGAEWAGAQHLYLDNETEPSQNIPAIVDTEVFMMEDGINFYVAFAAYDPDPEQIRAFFSDRDSCWEHDRVGVVIDTFNDERRAFQFFANPFGVQMDATCDDIAGSTDFSWNAIWDAAGEVNDNGFVVEMKIPLDQLRFPAGIEKQTWGIDLMRYYPRDKRHRFSNNFKDYNISCYLCQLEKAEGFDNLEQDLNLRFVPTLTASYSKNRLNPRTDRMESDSKIDAGIDIRWGINQDSYLNATINPDFSQVEADSAQLNVNNTYSLFFAEKRDFFLEGADYFNTNMSMVHSRNIASPDYGIKLTGKRDVHTYGLFFTNDETTNFIIPGSQGSFIASLGNVESRNSVLRYRSAVSRDINLGVILTDRRAENYSNTAAGLDGKFRIGSSDEIKMQFMKSYSEYPEIIRTYYGQKAKINDSAFLLDYSHDDSSWYWRAKYTEYGNDFRADMGFINRVDFKENYLSGGYTWRFGPESKFSRVYAGSYYKKSSDESDNDLGDEFEVSINMDGPFYSYMSAFYRQGEEFYNGRFFDKSRTGIFGRVRPAAGVDMSLDINFGDDIDYMNTRQGKQVSVNPWVIVQIGKHFEANLRHKYQRMEVYGQKLYSTNLSDLRFTYQFTIRSSLRVTLQYSDTKRNTALYLFETDSRSKDLTTQVLYNYKLTPQTRFFVGYSDNGYQDDEMDKIYKTNRSLFSKLSYAW